MTQSTQLRKIIDDMFDGKQALLAKRLGKSAAQINQWLNGYRNISEGMALQIEQKLNLPLGWLNSEESLPLNKEYDKKDSHIISIEHIDILKVYGQGSEVADFPTIISKIDFTREHLDKVFGHHNVENIKIINNVGDGMAPTIPPKSVIFINTEIDYFVGDGIYAFLYCDGIYIKRLQKLPFSLIAISDNPKYKDFEIKKEYMEQFKIIGKYSGIITMLFE